MKFLSVIWSIVSLSVIGCFLVIWNFSSTVAKKPPCENRAEYIHVKLGEHVFEAPWKESWLYLKNGDNEINSYEACYKDGESPIDVTQFTFSPNVNDNKYGILNKKYTNYEFQEKTRHGFTLGIKAYLYDQLKNYKELDSFTRFVEPTLKKINKELLSLPKEGEFYVLLLPYEERYYIASEKDFVTTNGTPVSFICSPAGGVGGSIRCDTIVIWKNNIVFVLSDISIGHIMPSKLKEFYYDFLNYMESLEVKNQETNNKDTGTQP